MIPVDLYPHQQKMNDECREAMRQGYKHILMQGATGIGKSRMAAAQIQSAQLKGKKAAFIVPRRELVYQMSEQFSRFGIEHSFVAAGYGFNPFSSVHICTIGTLVNRLDKINPDVIFDDEVHIGGEQRNKIITHYQSKGAFSVGLSATPKRLDSRGLGIWYQKMINGPSIRWLIDNGFLSQFRLFAPNTPDLTGIKTVAGEFAKGMLADKMEDDRVLIGNAVEHYRKHALGRINLTFCVSIKHSEITNQAFLDAGIPSMCVDAETPDAERKRIFRMLARREILNVCSVDLVTTGFDLSAAASMDVTVESISVLRPTQSLALYSQIMGRALRKKEMPALIFDHAGNTRRFGMPDTEREWRLEDEKRGNGIEREKKIDVRQCPKCDYCHAPAPVCPNCNHVYVIKSRAIDEIDGELQEIKEIQLKADKKKRRAACKTLDELIKFAEDEGTKNPRKWAAKWWSLRNQYKRGGNYLRG